MSIAESASTFAHDQASRIKEFGSEKKQEVDMYADAMQETGLNYPVAGQVSLGRLQAYVIAFVVVGVAGTVGLDIMSSVKANINNTDAETGAAQAIDGMNELLGFLPVIGLVVAAAVVIGLVSGFGRSASGTMGRA
jgi:hypothetical protein